jgi:antitoxin (DNA-binding transcriptional repressor) of toxin-antitoxin stability system
MKTLTITDAKKNLGKRLQAAARGEDIGIVAGADVIALRKVEVESTDYAWREYGVTPEEVAAYERKVDAEYKRLKKAGKLVVIRNRKELEELIEKNRSSFGLKSCASWRTCRKPPGTFARIPSSSW